MRFNLTPWTRRPATPMRRPGAFDFDSPFGNFFDDFFRGFDWTPATTDGDAVLAPSLDVAETDEAYKITVELPGVGEDDLELTWADGVLTIAGEKKTDTTTEEGDVRRSERTYGSFRRQLALPAEVDGDKVEANFDKGVLTVSLPKTAEAERVRKIVIGS